MEKDNGWSFIIILSWDLKLNFQNTDSILLVSFLFFTFIFLRYDLQYILMDMSEENGKFMDLLKLSKNNQLIILKYLKGKGLYLKEANGVIANAIEKIIHP
jgi:hypothetical protein